MSVITCNTIFSQTQSSWENTNGWGESLYVLPNIRLTQIDTLLSLMRSNCCTILLVQYFVLIFKFCFLGYSLSSLSITLATFSSNHTSLPTILPTNHTTCLTTHVTYHQTIIQQGVTNMVLISITSDPNDFLSAPPPGGPRTIHKHRPYKSIPDPLLFPSSKSALFNIDEVSFAINSNTLSLMGNAYKKKSGQEK